MANAVKYAILCTNLSKTVSREKTNEFQGKNKSIFTQDHDVSNESIKRKWLWSINRTVPSGSISNKCFGVCACKPVRTYCPDFPCDSRTKKSPSCLSSASAAWRLIDAWNHCSVSSWDLCTSADSENGSTEMTCQWLF